jgi:hypothetical protein
MRWEDDHECELKRIWNKAVMSLYLPEEFEELQSGDS